MTSCSLRFHIYYIIIGMKLIETNIFVILGYVNKNELNWWFMIKWYPWLCLPITEHCTNTIWCFPIFQAPDPQVVCCWPFWQWLGSKSPSNSPAVTNLFFWCCGGFTVTSAACSGLFLLPTCIKEPRGPVTLSLIPRLSVLWSLLIAANHLMVVPLHRTCCFESSAGTVV